MDVLEAECACGRQLAAVELRDGTFALVHADCRPADHDPVIW